METESQLSNRTLPLKPGDYILSYDGGGVSKVTATRQTDDDDNYIYNGSFDDQKHMSNVREDAFGDESKYYLFKVQSDLVEKYKIRSLNARLHDDLTNVPEEVLEIIFDWTDSYTIIDEDTYLLHLEN